MRLRNSLFVALLLSGGVAFAQHTDPHADPHANPSQPTGATQPTGAHAVPSQGAAEEHGGSHAGSATHQTTSGAVHGSDAHANPHEKHHALDPINWFDFYAKDSEGKSQVPMIALIINFGLLMWIYVSKAKKPVAEALKSRRKEIGQAILNARRLLREAKERAKSYQGQLESLDADAANAKSALIEAGKVEKEKIIEEAQEKVVRLEKDAAFLLDQEKKQMSIDLYRETVERAVREAEDVLKKRMTLADHERLAEDFLTQVVAKRTSMAPPQRASLSPPRSNPPPRMPPAGGTEGAS